MRNIVCAGIELANCRGCVCRRAATEARTYGTLGAALTSGRLRRRDGNAAPALQSQGPDSAQRPPPVTAPPSRCPTRRVPRCGEVEIFTLSTPEDGTRPLLTCAQRERRSGGGWRLSRVGRRRVVELQSDRRVPASGLRRELASQRLAAGRETKPPVILYGQGRVAGHSFPRVAHSAPVLVPREVRRDVFGHLVTPRGSGDCRGRKPTAPAAVRHGRRGGAQTDHYGHVDEGWSNDSGNERLTHEPPPCRLTWRFRTFFLGPGCRGV